MTELQVLQEIRNLLEAYTPPKQNMTVEDVAEYLQVSESFVYDLKATYGLPHVRIKGAVRFIKTDVDEWVRAHRVATPEQEIVMNDGRRKSLRVVGAGRVK